MFVELFAEDHNDLEMRLDKAHKFVQDVNDLLEIYFKDKPRYKQNLKDAITYLNLRNPEDNYLYQYAPVKAFAEYMEFADVVESAQYFSLKKYYAMCDEVREVISVNTELLERHKAYLPECVREVNGELNLLVYDIIYCAYAYKLYEELGMTSVPKRAKSKTALEKKGKIEKLRQEISSLEKMHMEIADELDAVEEINIFNYPVDHKKYGKGIVSEQFGTKIVVDFQSGQKLFSLPNVIALKQLAVDEKIFDIAVKKYLLMQKYENISKEIRIREIDIHLIEA